MNTTPTSTELEQELTAARDRERQHVEQVAAETQARELAYRRQRLAKLDRRRLYRDKLDAERALQKALVEDPLFSALIDRLVAPQRQFLAAQAAHADAVAVALADGEPAPHDPHLWPSNDVALDVLRRVIENEVAARADEYRNQVDADLSDAVRGDASPEAMAAAGQASDAQRQREAAEHLNVGSVDVTGMTEAERAQRGLPPGRPPK